MSLVSAPGSFPIELVSEPLLRFGPEGLCAEANSAAAEVLRRPAAGLMGVTLAELEAQLPPGLVPRSSIGADGTTWVVLQLSPEQGLPLARRLRQQSALASLSWFALTCRSSHSLQRLALSVVRATLSLEGCALVTGDEHPLELTLDGFADRSAELQERLRALAGTAREERGSIQWKPLPLGTLPGTSLRCGLGSCARTASRTLVMMGFSAAERAFAEDELHFLTAVTEVVAQVWERLQQDEARRRADEGFRELLDHSTEGVVIHRDGRVVYANPAARQFFGTPLEVSAGEGRSSSGAALARILRAAPGTARDGESFSFTRADGAQVWAQTLSISIPFEAQTSVLTFVHDRCAQHEAELAAQGSAASFRALIEQAPDIIAVHRDGHLVFVNPAAAASLGYAGPEELVGRPYSAVVHPDDLEAAAGMVARAAEGASLDPAERRLIRKDGSAVPVEVKLLKIQFNGEPAVLSFARDLTERRRLQTRLALADRMLSVGTLAGGAAHELNNPLAYVTANLSYLKDSITQAARRGALPAELQDCLEVLDESQNGAERMRGIIRDLKTFSNSDEVTHGTVELRRLVETSVAMTLNRIHERALVVTDLSEPVLVDGSEARLGQVLVNLLVNAAQAIPEGSPRSNTITVRLRATTDEAVIEVQDTGSGIRPEILPRIFDPFFTTRKVGQGTGLGLAVAHNIIREHLGEISVESTPGGGSTFRIRLPRGGRAPLASPVAAVSAEGQASSRGRILVIDDEPLVAKAIERALRRDHDVVVETRPHEALRLLLSGQNYDAVLCDLLMPELSGMELHRQLAQQAPAQLSRVIFLSGGAFTPEAKDFIARAGVTCLEKPFTPETLRERVREVVTPSPGAAGPVAHAG